MALKCPFCIMFPVGLLFKTNVGLTLKSLSVSLNTHFFTVPALLDLAHVGKTCLHGLGL